MSYANKQLDLAKSHLLGGNSAAALDCAARGISNLTDKDVPTIAQQYPDANEAIAYLEALIAAESAG